MAKILIIDDEADMRFAMRMLLERTGHQVAEAGDGEAALKRIGEDHIDLALLDMRLPGMDGIQILQRLKTEIPNLPVIMVTGYGNVELADQALQMGADHYLSKPFHNKELINVIHGILQKRGLPIPEAPEPVDAIAVVPTTASLPSLPVGKKRWLAYGAAGVALVAGLAFVFRPPQRDHKVLYKNASALVFQGNTLWAADWFTQSIYVHDATQSDLKVKKTYFLPGVHVTGMALGGDALYTADSWAKVLHKHKLDDNLTVTLTVKSPGDAPCALFFDGKYLWSCDLATGKIYQHEPDARLTVVASYASPGSAPVGFFKDAQYGWSLDSKTRQLYKRRLDSSLTLMQAFQLPEWQEGAAPLSAFTWRGKELWYARTDQPELHVRSPRQLVEMKLP